MDDLYGDLLTTENGSAAAGARWDNNFPTHARSGSGDKQIILDAPVSTYVPGSAAPNRLATSIRPLCV
jgi:hypothetical protein